jgi:hypothetical protein
MVGSAAMNAGVGFLESSMSRQMGLEHQGRSFGDWKSIMLPKSYSLSSKKGTAKKWIERAGYPSGAMLRGDAMKHGARFGFNANEMIQSTMSMLPLAGGGKAGRKELSDFVSGTMMPYGSSAGLGTGTGPIQDLTAAMRSGGRSFDDVESVLGGAVARSGAGNARQGISILTAIKGAIDTLVQITGSATKSQIRGAASLHGGLTSLGKFSPEVIPGLSKMLHSAGISPGGGAPGQVAMLQTMGFGAADLDRQVELARQMGMENPERFGVKRNYLEAKLAQQSQDPKQSAESLLLASRKLAGNSGLGQAEVLTNLVSGLGLPTARKLVSSEPGSQRNALLTQVGKIHRDGVDATYGKLMPTKEIKKNTKLIEEFNKMVNLSLSINNNDLAGIARSLTKIKIALVGPVSTLLLSLPKQITSIFDSVVKGVNALGGSVKSKADTPKTKAPPK